MMDITFKKLIPLGILSFSLGVLLIFLFDFSLTPPLLTTIGIELVAFELIRRMLYRKDSVSAFGKLLLGFSALNFLRHAEFFYILNHIPPTFEFDEELLFLPNFWLQFLWLFVSLSIVGKGLGLAFRKDDSPFMDYTDSKEFKTLFLIILLLMLLETPVFGIHGDFGGGLHGHGFWDAWMHIH